MEKNNKEYSTNQLSLQNSTNLDSSINNESARQDVYSGKVHFYSDFISETVGNLDITV